ncbi:MAG TPA: hypothetical protein VLC09_04260 [Polyangiaceae bacterium]|nr:hypothetical protein [Polyangiaceae bacterium]
MGSEKTGKRYAVQIPLEGMDVLRWHVETQLKTSEQQDSDLLFPSVTGGFRAPNVLNQPFAEVAEAIGVKYRFTQRGMRRTFQDLARAAEEADLLTRSVSGHSTAHMQEHYSTVRGDERREGLARVIQLVQAGDGGKSVRKKQGVVGWNEKGPETEVSDP